MIKENVGRSVRVKIRSEVLDGVITDQCYDAGKYIYTVGATLENGSAIILRDVPGDDVEILPDLRDLAEAYLRRMDREEISRLCDATSAIGERLEATFQKRLDAMLPVLTERLKTPAPSPDDDVEIIIDPTPEQVENEDVLWGCWWDLPEFLDLAHVGPVTRLKGAHIYKHHAYVVQGHLGPVELVARVRQMLAEKKAEK